MKKICYAFILASLMFCTISCTSSTKGEHPKIVETGWSNDNTYTVSAEDISEKGAVEKAKYQILKDIVDVRVKNNSRYTDIIKIQGEFEIPLKNGVIINSKTTPAGIQIFFQIRDNGLRQKFQRK
jgi:hypothetical protein